MVFFAVWAVCALLAGCSPAPEPDAAIPSPLGAHGRIRLTVEGGSQGVSVDGQVGVLRYVAVDPETADTLAGSDFGDAELEVGRCEVVDRDQRLAEALASVPEEARVLHLDAGEILVHISRLGASSLSPRLRPALFPFVAGVQYESWHLAGVVEPLVEPPEASVTSLGGDHVGAFHATAALPPQPAAVSARLDAGGHLLVQWMASAARDTLLVSVRGAHTGPEVRCRVSDDGSLVIYRPVLEQLGDQALRGPLTVAVERLQRVPFAAPGLQWGELEVAAAFVTTAQTK